MKVYTIRDFRNNMKAALDAVNLGEEVYIDRLSIMYQVVPVKTKHDYKDVPKPPSVPVLPGQMTVDEGIENIEELAAQQDAEIPEIDWSKAKRTSFPNLKPTDWQTAEGQRLRKLEGHPKPPMKPQFFEGNEKPCCGKTKPCQHWQWDSDTSSWVNSLSGRKREAES